MGGKHSRGTASCVAATWQEMMCSTLHAYWDCKLSLGHLLWRGRQSSTSCWCVTTTILHIPQTPPPSLSSSLCLCGRGSRWKPKVMGAFWNCILPFSELGQLLLSVHSAWSFQPATLSQLQWTGANHTMRSAPPIKCLQDLKSVSPCCLVFLCQLPYSFFFFGITEQNGYIWDLVSPRTRCLHSEKGNHYLMKVPLLKLRAAGMYRWLLSSKTSCVPLSDRLWYKKQAWELAWKVKLIVKVSLNL